MDKRPPVVAAICLMVMAVPPQVFAYVYPEHREIAVVSIRELDGHRAALLNSLWAEARKGYELRLSPEPASPNFTDTSSAIDFAAWPAIAGDHSCSAADMLNTVLTSDWIVNVSRIAAKLEQNLHEAGGESFGRTNALRESDFRLLAADPQYATRAGSNNVHFLLSRQTTIQDIYQYLRSCLSHDNEINALGVYAWYHHGALVHAWKLSEGTVPAEDRGRVIRAMLADEAFALHFLEDAFAAGHIAGSWGSAPLRKGTHDYYNEHGLAVTTWTGDSYVLLGDAWMRHEDALTAARVVRRSLEQMLDAVKSAYGGSETDALVLADTLDVCRAAVLPPNDLELRFASILGPVVEETPMPGLATGSGELPRFNAELGPFIGLTSAFNLGWHRGGFLKHEEGLGTIGGVELAVRLGLGLEGVLNESGDGLMFLDLGVAREGASNVRIAAFERSNEFGTITAAIPARTAFIARLRIPFFVIPFDLIIAGPLFALISPETLTKIAVVAANGGALGWQRGIATSFGRFQIILGREVGIYYYGSDYANSRVLAYPGPGQFDQLYLMDIQSLKILLPVLDYRNFRTFSRDQSSGVHVQLYTGVNIPTKVSVSEPANAIVPPYRWIWYFGIRASLDWRYYF